MKPTVAGSEALRLGGLLVAIGAAGVVLASAFYAASPHEIALPEPFDPVAARAGALAGAFTLQAAGKIGVVADIVLVAGSLSVAAAVRERTVEALGWIGLALATAVFVGVDAIAGFVLAPLAHADGDAFEGFKRLFDGLFLLGTAIFGVSTWVAAPIANRAISRLLRAISIVSVLATTACALGLPAGRAVGIAIAAGSALFVAVGASLTRERAERASSPPSAASASLPTP